jgi:universal stress protein E
MLAIRRILVAVKDLGAPGRPAVRKAAQIAQASNAQVELFHSLATPLYADLAIGSNEGLEGLERTVRQNALRRLERIASALRKHHIKVSVAAEWDYPVYDAIIRRAVRIKADLIVAAAHAGSHLMPGLMRLTDWELVRLSPMPLLLVKTSRPYRRPAVLVAVDPTHAFAKPLKLDQALLKAGRTLSRELGGTLHAVYAYWPLPSAAMPPQAMAMASYAVQKLQRQARRNAEAELTRALRGTGIPLSQRYLIGRHPVDAILQAARKSRSAIVVMGAISRSGFKRLLIGNTAESILDETRCDILVIKPAHFQNRVPRSVRGARVVMPMPSGWPGYY